VPGSRVLGIFGLVLSLVIFLPSTSEKIAFADFQILDVTETFHLNSTQNIVEVRLVSNQSAISVLSMMIALNNTEDSVLAIREIKAFDHLGNAYAMDPSQSLSPSNNTTLMLGHRSLPSALPAGGGIGIILEISNATRDVAIDLTFVYGSGSNEGVTIELVPLAPWPYDVVQNHLSLEVAGISEESELLVDNSFTDPEIHCETCTRVEYRPNASDSVEAAYVVNATDLGIAQKMNFWVMGEGEAAFNVAGKRLNQTISYEESVRIALDREWRQIEVDLAGNNLSDITHPFGFTLDGVEDQTFYLKGMTFS
jgi:hypothetical protein